MNNHKATKTIDFGKIDFYSRGRKNNKVTVELCLYTRAEKNQIVFSAIANVYNTKGTDVVYCGQCFDSIKDFFKNNILFNKIYGWWSNYHLNDMHSLTIEQEEYLKSKDIPTNNYEHVLQILTDAGLEKDSDGIVYGKKFYYRPIPNDVLVEMKELIGF